MVLMAVRGSTAGRGSSRRVTSVDVAVDAGVSQATVARVFSSPERVAPATREKVTAAAERLGYVPNAIARSLKSQRTNIVGAVVPVVGEYWQHLLTAFSQRLAARGRQLLVFSFADVAAIDDVLVAVDQYRLDGLLMASANIGPTQLARARENGLPVVAFNQPAATGVVDSVSVDNEGGARALAHHLVDSGCRSVLFVGGVAAISTDQLRYRGAAQALGGRGIACPYTEAGSFSYDAGYQAVGGILDAGPLPDALMVAGDELAFGVLDGLAAAGVDVPTDVMVTGFDGLPQAAWAGYDLTTLTQPSEQLVESALELLLDAETSKAQPTAPDAEAPIPRTGNPAPRPTGPLDRVVPGQIRLGRTTRRPADG